MKVNDTIISQASNLIFYPSPAKKDTILEMFIQYCPITKYKMMNYIQEASKDFLKIDTPQMIEVDRLMIETYQIELIQMMENAGRCLAILARDRFLEGDPQAKRIAVFAGTGGNGGGALVCARRLINWGAEVEIYLTDRPDKFTPIPAHQLKILENMGVWISLGDALDSCQLYDLLIDGIIGYSVKGDPYGLPGNMIRWINKQEVACLSLDTPSGLDLSSGKIHTPTVEAQATLTLAMPKKGLFRDEARKVIGELYLGDISVPPKLYVEPSLNLREVNPFRYSDIVKIF